MTRSCSAKRFELSHLQNKLQVTQFLSENFYCLISRECDNWKLTVDSAGNTISLFPVKAEPPAPAPAPAASPMAAPFPPPANPPISPPSAAPPPVMTAVRLPLPFAEKVCTSARTGRLEP